MDFASSANQDALTQLENRRVLEETLDRERHRALRTSLLLVDIDFFKLFNDLCGRLFELLEDAAIPHPGSPV